MKKGTFKGLLFQEFYTDKKTYFYSVSAFLIITLLCLLGLLSFRYGNLGKYEHLMSPEAKPFINAMLKYYPLFGTFSIIPHKPFNSEKPMWKYFRRACPVPPFRLALAAYCYLIIGMLLCGGISSVWIIVYNLLAGTPITSTDWITVLCIIGFLVVSNAATEIMRLFIKSEETATMLIVIFMGVVFSIFFLLFPDGMANVMNLEWVPSLIDWCTSHILIIIVTILLTFAGALLIGLVCTTIRLGRREK